MNQLINTCRNILVHIRIQNWRTTQPFFFLDICYLLYENVSVDQLFVFLFLKYSVATLFSVNQPLFFLNITTYYDLFLLLTLIRVAGSFCLFFFFKTACCFVCRLQDTTDMFYVKGLLLRNVFVLSLSDESQTIVIEAVNSASQYNLLNINTD